MLTNLIEFKCTDSCCKGESYKQCSSYNKATVYPVGLFNNEDTVFKTIKHMCSVANTDITIDKVRNITNKKTGKETFVNCGFEKPLVRCDYDGDLISNGDLMLIGTDIYIKAKSDIKLFPLQENVTDSQWGYNSDGTLESIETDITVDKYYIREDREDNAYSALTALENCLFTNEGLYYLASSILSEQSLEPGDEFYHISEYDNYADYWISPKLGLVKCFKSYDTIEEFKEAVISGVQFHLINEKFVSFRIDNPNICDKEQALKHIQGCMDDDTPF